jgi:hypothetical protein
MEHMGGAAKVMTFVLGLYVKSTSTFTGLLPDEADTKVGNTVALTDEAVVATLVALATVAEST